MLFNSWQFAVFLPLVFVAYWILPHRYRWAVMLFFSCCFYCSAGAHAFLLLAAVTTGTYFAGILIASGHNNGRKIVFMAAIGGCLMVLTVYKYLGFLIDNINTLLKLTGLALHPATLKLILPIGISFYLFNVIAYLIDVYMGRILAERHFGIYALYVTFFPKMLAGPIERAGNLIPQFREERVFDPELGIDGLKRIVWGYFKKIVVADTLALYVDTVYNHIRSHSGFSLFLAAFLFSIQIYCDFSGYSDIALGTAELFGIRMGENFKSPYFSSSVKEFWSKWHISLSTWFRDYVYIPLGGSRVGRIRQYLNLMATFLVSGLWHGASWTFVVWGGIHGAAQVLEKMLQIRSCKKKNIRWMLRCGVLFCFATVAWVFFRADNIGDAFYLLTHMLSGINSPVTYLRTGFKEAGMTSGGLMTFILSMIPLIIYDLVSSLLERDAREVLSKKKAWFQWLFYLGIGLIVIFFSQKGVAAEFVYMQF